MIQTITKSMRVQRATSGRAKNRVILFENTGNPFIPKDVDGKHKPGNWRGWWG